MGDARDVRVEVLLKEYDTLRAEILQRVKTRWELIGFVGVVAGLALTRDADRWWVAGTVAIALAVGVFAWLWLRRGIERCATHIKTLERRINALVGDDASGGLLTWETNQARGRLFR